MWPDQWEDRHYKYIYVNTTTAVVVPIRLYLPVNGYIYVHIYFFYWETFRVSESNLRATLLYTTSSYYIIYINNIHTHDYKIKKKTTNKQKLYKFYIIYLSLPCKMLKCLAPDIYVHAHYNNNMTTTATMMRSATICPIEKPKIKICFSR